MGFDVLWSKAAVHEASTASCIRGRWFTRSLKGENTRAKASASMQGKHWLAPACKASSCCGSATIHSSTTTQRQQLLLMEGSSRHPRNVNEAQTSRGQPGWTPVARGLTPMQPLSS